VQAGGDAGGVDILGMGVFYHLLNSTCVQFSHGGRNEEWGRLN